MSIDRGDAFETGDFMFGRSRGEPDPERLRIRQQPVVVGRDIARPTRRAVGTFYPADCGIARDALNTRQYADG